ncbi:MAG: hypothetical protein KJ607_03455 [Bacteroidetes bacterium]|nr:hypothetical protein [Bacteroidota bacterium]
MKKLLSVISTSSPYTPNLTKVGKETGITDQRTLLRYLSYLEKAEIIRSLTKDATGNMILRKPEKLYINNTNICFALEPLSADKGTLREIFFYSQIAHENRITATDTGDFLVNGKYCFEIGGRNKTKYRIRDRENAFLALDDIETGIFNKIPLWLFGFLY